jgi:hypothetical protein
MDKCFIKSVDLMCCHLHLLLKPIHIPIVLLLQLNLFNYLTNFVFDGAIFRIWYGGHEMMEKLLGPTQPITVLLTCALRCAVRLSQISIL